MYVVSSAGWARQCSPLSSLLTTDTLSAAVWTLSLETGDEIHPRAQIARSPLTGGTLSAAI